MIERQKEALQVGRIVQLTHHTTTQSKPDFNGFTIVLAEVPADELARVMREAQKYPDHDSADLVCFETLAAAIKARYRVTKR